MKRKFMTGCSCLFAASAILMGGEASAGQNAEKNVKSLRVLMIGNSFSICVGDHLPALVQSVPGTHLSLTSLYIGGCPLQKHWENIQETEKDPEAKQYRMDHWETGKEPVRDRKSSIQEQLKQEWDIITLQQASHSSWNPETYQPYFDNIVKYLKKNSPKAEIVIQQTWAYRNSDARIAPDTKTWGFDQAGMYERLTKCYCAIAKEYGFRIIPTGLAVQNSRKDFNLIFPRPEAVPQGKFTPPDFPSQANEVVGAYFWHKNDKGKMELTQDSIHLNNRGTYLQACVWFAKLFNQSVLDVKYVPDDMDNDYAAFLRKCAQDAVNANLP